MEQKRNLYGQIVTHPICELCCHEFACRVMQKIVECSSIRPDMLTLLLFTPAPSEDTESAIDSIGKSLPLKYAKNGVVARLTSSKKKKQGNVTSRKVRDMDLLNPRWQRIGYVLATAVPLLVEDANTTDNSENYAPLDHQAKDQGINEKAKLEQIGHKTEEKMSASNASLNRAKQPRRQLSAIQNILEKNSPVDMALSPSGSKLLNTVLTYCCTSAMPIPMAMQRIIEAIMSAVPQLLTDNIGIRTLQIIGEKANYSSVEKIVGSEFRSKVLSAALSNLETLCKHPLGCKVIEEYMRTDAAARIVSSLLMLPETRLTELMNHKIGNYVIQTTFDFAPASEQVKLAKEIQKRTRQNQIEHKNVAQRSVLFSIFEGAIDSSEW